MPEISKDVVALLQYLAPGFLAAWMFYGLTSHEKPSQFERVVQALLFTVIIQSFVSIFRWCLLKAGHFYTLGPWSESVALGWSLIVAFLFGIGISKANNADWIHGLMRRFGFTTRSGYPGEWYGAFATQLRYVVLHFKNGNRIFGWPARWPSTKNGHFYLINATWEVDGKSQDLVDSDGILLDASEVVFVEFVKHLEEQSEEFQNSTANEPEGTFSFHRGEQAGQCESPTDDCQAKNACAPTG